MSVEDKLTKQEQQVAALIAEGYDYAEIGARVGLEAQSVKNRATKIYKKLGLDLPGRRPSILLTRLIVKEQTGVFLWPEPPDGEV